MLTGIFKDRSAKERIAGADQVLAELLASCELRRFTVMRNREIGPFVAEYLFPEQSLIVELAPACPGRPADDSSMVGRSAARSKFFSDMGYVVFAIDPGELMRRPRRVLARLRATLEG